MSDYIGASGRKLQLIMTTCDRPSGDSYLLSTLKHFAGHPLFLVDGTGLGHVGSFALALERMKPDHDVLFLQDDLKTCKNFVNSVLRCPVPSESAFVTFFDGHHLRDVVVAPARVPFLHRVAVHRGLRGLQAVLFPAHTIGFLKSKWPSKYIPAIGDLDDLHVTYLLQAYFTWFSICVPNLVQHAGHMSATLRKGKVVDNRKRMSAYSQNYTGDDFDADSLVF